MRKERELWTRDGVRQSQKLFQHPQIMASVSGNGGAGLKKPMGTQRICLIHSFPPGQSYAIFNSYLNIAFLKKALALPSFDMNATSDLGKHSYNVK